MLVKAMARGATIGAAVTIQLMDCSYQQLLGKRVLPDIADMMTPWCLPFAGYKEQFFPLHGKVAGKISSQIPSARNENMALKKLPDFRFEIKINFRKSLAPEHRSHSIYNPTNHPRKQNRHKVICSENSPMGH